MPTRPHQSLTGRSIPYSIGGKEPLPPVDGPKLSAFEHRKSPIEYLELLSVPPDKVSGSGGHGHVFRVRIRGDEYALKVFKFFNVAREQENIYPEWNCEVDSATFAFQSDPFFAECRAYARIEEIQRKRRRSRKTGRPSDIAVPCFGFMGIHAKVERFFHDKFSITDWNRPEEQYRLLPKEREPFRAIVKQYVDSPHAVVNPAKMLRDLRTLRNGGIFQQDIYARNYKGGLLVDFSIAWTDPHWVLRVMNDVNLELWKKSELQAFDEMIQNSGIKTTVKAAKATKTYAKLRNRENLRNRQTAGNAQLERRHLAEFQAIRSTVNEPLSRGL